MRRSLAESLLAWSLGRSQEWTGNLIDVGCMSNALHRVSSVDETLLPDPFLQFWQTLETSQRADQERNSGGWSPQGQPQTPSRTAWTRDSDGEPEASEQQIAMHRAQLKRAKVLEHVVKACTLTPPTMHYGLVISGGQLLCYWVSWRVQEQNGRTALSFFKRHVIAATMLEADTPRRLSSSFTRCQEAPFCSPLNRAG